MSNTRVVPRASGKGAKDTTNWTRKQREAYEMKRFNQAITRQISPPAKKYPILHEAVDGLTADLLNQDTKVPFQKGAYLIKANEDGAEVSIQEEMKIDLGTIQNLVEGNFECYQLNWKGRKCIMYVNERGAYGFTPNEIASIIYSESKNCDNTIFGNAILAFGYGPNES